VLEVDEQIEAGLVPEVYEETRITVAPVALTGVYKNMERAIVALVFRGDVAARGGLASPETRAIAWLRDAEVRERMSEAYAVRLLDALDPTGPHVRAHDGQRLV
jgi:8-oxo-dGTP diphosphatase